MYNTELTAQNAKMIVCARGLVVEVIVEIAQEKEFAKERRDWK